MLGIVLCVEQQVWFVMPHGSTQVQTWDMPSASSLTLATVDQRTRSTHNALVPILVAVEHMWNSGPESCSTIKSGALEVRDV